MTTTDVITGDKRLDRKLNHLKGRGGNTIIRKTLREAIRVTAAGLRAAAPTTTEKRAIGFRFKRNSRTGYMLSKAGIGVAKKQGKVKRHAHFRSTGTRDRRQATTGRATGHVTKQPFIPRVAASAARSGVHAAQRKAREELKKQARP